MPGTKRVRELLEDDRSPDAKRARAEHSQSGHEDISDRTRPLQSGSRGLERASSDESEPCAPKSRGTKHVHGNMNSKPKQIAKKSNTLGQRPAARERPQQNSPVISNPPRNSGDLAVSLLHATWQDTVQLRLDMGGIATDCRTTSAALHRLLGASGGQQAVLVTKPNHDLKILYNMVFCCEHRSSWVFKDVQLEHSKEKDSTTFLAALLGAFVHSEIFSCKPPWKDTAFYIQQTKYLYGRQHVMEHNCPNISYALGRYAYYSRIDAPGFQQEIDEYARDLAARFYKVAREHLGLLPQARHAARDNYVDLDFGDRFIDDCSKLFKVAYNVKARIDAGLDDFEVSWVSTSSGFQSQCMDDFNALTKDRQPQDGTQVSFMVSSKFTRLTWHGKPQEGPMVFVKARAVLPLRARAEQRAIERPAQKGSSRRSYFPRPTKPNPQPSLVKLPESLPDRRQPIHADGSIAALQEPQAEPETAWYRRLGSSIAQIFTNKPPPSDA